MRGNSLVVQWLGLGAFTAEGLGSTPGWGTKIPQAARCNEKNKNKKIFLIKFNLIRFKNQLFSHAEHISNVQ